MKLDASLVSPFIEGSTFPQPKGTAVSVIFEGAAPSLDFLGTFGEFFGGVEDPSLLQGAEHIRMNWQLYSNPATGAASVDEVELPFDF